MSGTPAGGRKAAEKLLAADPLYYERLSEKAMKARGGHASPGSFKAGADHTKAMASKGGKARAANYRKKVKK